MDITRFTRSIEAMGPNTERQALISGIQAVEKECYAYLFEENKRRWYPGKALEIAKHLCRMKDTVIQKALELSGGIPQGIAVIAVGGYGREELSPYSDIDIMILHTQKAPIEEFARVFLYFLWDLGYRLGNSTRTLANVNEHAREDDTFLTALFEARLIAGDGSLYQGLKPVLKKVLSSRKKSFLKARSAEIYALVQNAGSEVLVKEPDIKNSAGGLRSVHLMEWLNFAFHFEPRLQGLASVLPPIIYKKVRFSYDFLLYIRNLLHFMTGRHHDILNLEHHLTVADFFCLAGNEKDRIKKLMRKYYERSMDILLALLYFIEELELKNLKGIKNRAVLKGKQVDGKYFVIDGMFYIPDGLKTGPVEAFDAVLCCFSKGYRFTYSLLRYLKSCSRELNEESRHSKEVFEKFKRVLALPHSAEALNALKLSGFLYDYLRIFHRIRHLIVHNPFHQYTVDQHSLEAVKALEKLLNQDYEPLERGKYLPLLAIAEHYRQNIWILKLALLLHDIGKAYEGDHAKNGVEMVLEGMENFPIKGYVIDLIVFLIDSHLLLSSLVRRGDVNDQRLISDLTRQLIFTPFPLEYFEALYLLTFADIYATSPKNFKSYIADLLHRLYLNTSSHLLQKAGPEYYSDMINETKKALAAVEGLEGIGGYIDRMGQKYGLSSTPEEISEDFRIIRELKDGECRTKVKVYNDYFKVKFFTHDRHGLFAFLSGLLLLNGADIVRAEINTYQGIAIDQFTITRIFNIDFDDNQMKSELQYWTEDLEKYVRNYQNDPQGLDNKIKELRSRMQLPHPVFKRKTEVTFNQLSNGLCSIKVSAMDRPAFLYDLTRYLSERRIEILGAHIDTVGWYVSDIFEIATTEPLDDKAKSEIRDSIYTIAETPI